MPGNSDTDLEIRITTTADTTGVESADTALVALREEDDKAIDTVDAYNKKLEELNNQNEIISESNRTVSKTFEDMGSATDDVS